MQVCVIRADLSRPWLFVHTDNSSDQTQLITQSTIEFSAILLVTILTDFNYATLTSPYIFQKTVECKLPLMR